MHPTSTRNAAPVLEVFASVQGEGAFVGEPQVFLRLHGCPMRCVYCDTPGSWQLAGDARVATPEGSERRAPWATPFQAACWIAEAEPREPRTVSVTGGEPLLWPEFLLELPKMLGGRRLHLETGGGHPHTLERVRDAFDHLSIDLKLPADMAAPEELGAEARAAGLTGLCDELAPRDEREWTRARRAVLRLARGRDAALKLVLVGGRQVEDYRLLLEDAARLTPDLPLYLTPATPVRDALGPSPDVLQGVLEDARDLGLTTRVLPQVHRQLRLP